MDEPFTHGLSDDAPKSSRDQDRLGHAPFADLVALVATSVDASNGFVLGIHGAWGSGKSTTLNFVAECVREHNQHVPDHTILHVDFRPWLITGHQDLVSAFLKVLSEKLADPKSRRRRWFQLGSKVAHATDAVGAVVKVASALADPTAGLASSVAGNVTKKSLDAFLKHFSESPSLQAAHKDMSDRLRKNGERILVTIDDIDRLETAEIRCIMQMVKSVGRLPNVVYLLCYDRAIVARALGDPEQRTGPSFTEKIVQQELELPVPQQSQLLGMLDQEIGFLLARTDRSERWHYIVRDGLRRWIRSPRDVVRLANAVRFSWSALEDEIDPQDLLAMEGIRLFDPNVFGWIRDNRSLVFGENRFMLPADGAREAAVARLKLAVPDKVRAETTDLVAVLFPQLAALLIDAQQVWTEERADFVTRRGVASPAGYDAYFGLYPSADAIPLGELHEFMSATEPTGIESVLRRYLNRTNSDGKPMIGDLLEEIYLRFHGERAAHPEQPILDALFAVGEEIIRTDLGPSGMFDANPRAELRLIIRRMLEIWGLPDAGEHLIEAFNKAASPTLLAEAYEVCALHLGVLESSSTHSNPCVSKADFETLGNILCDQIRQARDSGTLSNAPFYFGIVRSWKLLCGPEEPRRWLQSGIESNAEFMVKVCRGLVTHSLDTDEPEYHMRDVPDQDLYELPFLNQAARKHADNANLTDDEHRLLSTVLQASSRMLEADQATGMS